MKLKNLSNLCFLIKDMFTKLISFKLHYTKHMILSMPMIMLVPSRIYARSSRSKTLHEIICVSVRGDQDACAWENLL